MNILFDSKKPEFKTPFGCLKQDEVCTLTLKIPKHCKANKIAILIENDSCTINKKILMQLTSTQDEYEIYVGKFSLSQSDLYYYHFKIYCDSYSFRLYKRGFDETSINSGEEWQITCYNKNFDNYDCFKGKVMYQIFPDRFYKSGDEPDLKYKLQPFNIHQNQDDVPIYTPDQNGVIQNNDFFGGNLQGIIKKLDYLKSLNVSIIYLNPIFMAYSNHRYDTANYMKIDPLLGTELDFQKLCDEAHKLDMKIILDGVFSHTGCNSIYFDKYNIFGLGAYNNPSSEFNSWFSFKSHNRDDYVSWWGIETLPCVNELSPHFIDYIITSKDSVINHWLNLGADGYRLDVADELPDEFIRLLNFEVKKHNKESLVIGEVWEDASNKISYSLRRTYFTEQELDSVMNYPYKDSIIAFVRGDCSSEFLANTLITIAENYPKPILDTLMNSLSTHDTMRILTVLGVDNHPESKHERAFYQLNEHELYLAIQKLKLATFLQFLVPGNACIYYGDEVGLEGFEDPFNRRFFPWNNQNLEILDFYKQITKIKVSEKTLHDGELKIINSSNDVLIFSRECNGEKIIVIASMRDSFCSFSSHELKMIGNGYAQGDMIHLNKYGFALLKA